MPSNPKTAQSSQASGRASTSSQVNGHELAHALQRIAVYLRDAEAKGMNAVAALTKLDSTPDKCEIASSWIDFYREHLVEIDQRMREIVSREPEIEDGVEEIAPPAKQRRTSSAETIVA